MTQFYENLNKIYFPAQFGPFLTELKVSMNFLEKVNSASFLCF